MDAESGRGSATMNENGWAEGLVGIRGEGRWISSVIRCVASLQNARLVIKVEPRCGQPTHRSRVWEVLVLA